MDREDWIIVPGKDSESPNARYEAQKRNASGIHADILIPGKGKPLRDQAVIFEDGKIVFVGVPDTVPRTYKNLSLQKSAVIMPGMCCESRTRNLRHTTWETHSHFFGASPDRPINMENMAMGNFVEAGARNVRALKDTLYAGFTSCVDLGGYAPELQKVINEGLILGPTLYGTGAAISMTGGHGDVFEITYGSARQKLTVNAPGSDAGATGVLLADGVDECRKAVRLNLRRGARVIKVMTTGAASRDDDPLLQQFSDEELRTIVDEAGRMGLVCAAHAVGKPGIMGAIRAGFKVIEHNSYADDEVFEAMKKNDVMLVATITSLRSILDNKDEYPPSTYEKVRKLAATHFKAYENAIKAGIKCAIGSDLFGGIGTVLSPGLNGNEVVYAVDAGMSPLEAIEAATAHGPDTIGLQAPKSGQIRTGYDADFLALDENPLDDIHLLKNPKNIKRIWKKGQRVKAPGLDPWETLDQRLESK